MDSHKHARLMFARRLEIAQQMTAQELSAAQAVATLDLSIALMRRAS